MRPSPYWVLLVSRRALRLVWLAIGAYNINRAGPRHLAASRHVIWHEATGADRQDTDAFAVALRERISQIGRAGGASPA